MLIADVVFAADVDRPAAHEHAEKPGDRRRTMRRRAATQAPGAQVGDHDRQRPIADVQRKKASENGGTDPRDATRQNVMLVTCIVATSTKPAKRLQRAGVGIRFTLRHDVAALARLRPWQWTSRQP